MTKRQKMIASCVDPFYDGFAKQEEVTRVKRMARGHWWYDDECGEYVAFSPKGKRKFFLYDFCSPAKPHLARKWKKTAKASARLWAEGKLKVANFLDKKNWAHYRNHPNPFRSSRNDY